MRSEQNKRRRFHVFWAWQDEREEAWLRDMEKQGWRLSRPGVLFYDFERAVPQDAVYKLDYQQLAKKNRGEYLGLFRDAGWEHVGSVSNWQYFRTPAAAGSNPDIFSDTESRIAKYRRLLAMLIVLLPAFNIGAMRMLRDSQSLLWVPYIGITLLWAYAIVRLVLRIGKLKKRGAKSDSGVAGSAT